MVVTGRQQYPDRIGEPSEVKLTIILSLSSFNKVVMLRQAQYDRFNWN